MRILHAFDYRLKNKNSPNPFPGKKRWENIKKATQITCKIMKNELQTRGPKGVGPTAKTGKSG